MDVPDAIVIDVRGNGPARTAAAPVVAHLVAATRNSLTELLPMVELNCPTVEFVVMWKWT